MECLLFLAYLIFLCETCLVGRSDAVNLAFMLVFAGLFLILEIYELFATSRSYFKLLSNYNDLATPILLIFYFFTKVFTGTESVWCLSILMVSAFFRGLSFFTINKQLRYFVRFLKGIFIDLVPFTMALGYCTFIFAFAFIASYEKPDVDLFMELFT